MPQEILAAAGMAEVAASIGLLLMWSGLFVITAAVIAGWMWRSKGAAITATLLLVAFTVLFAPWTAFGPVSSEDPDEIRIIASSRVAAVAWVVVSAIVVVSLPVIHYWHRAAATRVPPVTEADGP